MNTNTATKKRPILFSTPMVKAILNGSKSQTRRIVTEHNSQIGEGGKWSKLAFDSKLTFVDTGFPDSVGKHNYQYLHVPYDSEDGDERIFRVYCRWEPKQYLWVKETHYRFGHWIQTGNITKTGRQEWAFVAETDHVFYQDEPPVEICKDMTKTGWFKRPSLFMPRKLSRITMEITDVRVQRLSAISEEDAKAEGCDSSNQGSYPTCAIHMPPEWYKLTEQERWDDKWRPETERMQRWNTRNNYIRLWEKINGEESWNANPWVWCLSFKRISQSS
jgi:hypothetical protein